MGRFAAFRAPRWLVPLTIIVSAGGWAAAPSNADITLGRPSLGPTNLYLGCGAACTKVPLALSGEGALVQSPVNGVVVKWRFAAGLHTSAEYMLQVLKRGSGLSFTPTASSVPVIAAGAGVETFDSSLPIEVGDYIGIRMSGEAWLGAHEGGSVASFAPPIGEEGSTGFEYPYEVEFNAEVQPRPTVILLAPGSGPAGGGTAVKVAGTDFTGVTAVRFGGVPASSFTVEANNKLTAVAPAASPGVVDVSVTTSAGTSPATEDDRFEYTAPAAPLGNTSPHCVVPKLEGKTLKAAKKRARKANCRIGAVRKRAGATAKTGQVVKQRPAAGRVRGAGAGIVVTLG